MTMIPSECEQSSVPVSGSLRPPVFAIAPMIDWTDRHYRFLARQLSRHAVLYTEMIVAEAVLRGQRERLLRREACETPVVLQLGGNDPAKLAEAARIGEGFGYGEINLNVGCPSDRVQSGTFGACLMKTPDLVADCVAAMKAAVSIPVTVKCRIGVDDQDPELALRALTETVRAAGVDALWVHARKAWLQGLSPKENREIPPLDYDLVTRLKAENPDLFIGLNGGLNTLDAAQAALERVDGAMVGRAAYHDSSLLSGVDARLPHPLTGAPPETAPAGGFTEAGHRRDPAFWEEVRDAMAAHSARHIAEGGRLVHVTRHMVGLFQGWAGARRFRQILSAEATARDAGPDIIHRAFAEVLQSEAARLPEAV